MPSALRGVPASDLEECKPVVRAGQQRIQFERAPIGPDRFLQPAGTGKRDGHVLEDARIIGMIAQRKAIGGEGRVEIALTLQGKCLVEVVEALRLESTIRLAAQHAAQPGHAMRSG